MYTHGHASTHVHNSARTHTWLFQRARTSNAVPHNQAYQKDSVKFFLKARTVGLCMADNRLLNFHVVRSTIPVAYHHTEFVPNQWGRTLRDTKHKAKYPAYPDQQCYVNGTQTYFFVTLACGIYVLGSTAGTSRLKRAWH